MPQTTCRHVHANGALCQSPPLRNREYCHFHLDQIGRQLRAARARARHQPPRLKLPLLEDPFAVQIALMQVADAITNGELDVERGRLLMSLLRLASRNLNTARYWKQKPLFAAEADAGTAAAEWPTFEQENGLPPDFDLSVDPEVAFPMTQTLPLNPNEGLNGAPGLHNPNEALNGAPGNNLDEALRERIRRALGEASEPARLVNADQVELMEIYEHDGPQAAKKFADRMVRNDLRRERRMRRLHYEEVARNHSIKLAAQRLLEQQQREAREAARAQPAGDDASAISGASEAGDGCRKMPASAAAPQAYEAGSGTA